MLPNDPVTPSIRLVRELGKGGMGSVWIAWHERLKTEVVVKFVVGAYASHPEALARFEREAALAAQAKSPHVVQVFDFGMAENGLPYIAMEYLEGEDLATRVHREKRLNPRLFGEWLRQACSGLSRVHAKSIIHRDIKPENIFLCDDQGDVLVKILDFGIAKSEGAFFGGTQTGALLGTVYYMSPEQTMGAKNVDLRTDLWAMGVVAYFALTGVLPFDGEGIGAIVLAITSHTPPPPSSLVPELPRGVDAWMAKALAKDPAQRFQSAREMADAFLSATGQAPEVVAGGDFGAPVSRGSVPPGPFHSTTLSPATVRERGEDTLEAPAAKGRRLRAALLGVAALIVAGALSAVLLRAEHGSNRDAEARASSARPHAHLDPAHGSEALASADAPLMEPGPLVPPSRPLAASAAPRAPEIAPPPEPARPLLPARRVTAPATKAPNREAQQALTQLQALADSAKSARAPVEAAPGIAAKPTRTEPTPPPQREPEPSKAKPKTEHESLKMRLEE